MKEHERSRNPIPHRCHTSIDILRGWEGQIKEKHLRTPFSTRSSEDDFWGYHLDLAGGYHSLFGQTLMKKSMLVCRV